MSLAFQQLIDAMRERTLAEVRAHPTVQSCKALLGAEAADFLRAYRAHLTEKGSVVQTHGAAADIAAFSVAQAVLPTATVDAPFLLARIGWPSAEAWDAAMLARAEAGSLTTDEIVLALQSPGFAAQAASLLPFGGDAWAQALRSTVQSWSATRKATWTTLVEFARTTDMPLCPTADFLASGPVRKLSKAFGPRLPGILPCLERLGPPEHRAYDPNRPSELTRAAEENALLLHALVLFAAVHQPAGWTTAVARVREVASLTLPELGVYLPKLAHRAELALAGHVVPSAPETR